MISDVLGDLLVSASPGKDEVVQAGDAEHGVVDAVAFQSAVTKDLPALHPGEDALHAGTDFQAGSSAWPFSRRCGMTRPVPRQPQRW
ncbi:hypothetical protein RKD49_005700 [Streptomyces glaucescens]